MDVGEMQRSLEDYTKSMFVEGFLDEQFSLLQQLEDDTPDIVVEMITLVFAESARLISDLTRTLEQPNIDFKMVGDYVHEFKGCSLSLGALRVKNACIAFLKSCHDQNIEGCLRCFELLKQEYYLTKSKLEIFLKVSEPSVSATVDFN